MDANQPAVLPLRTFFHLAYFFLPHIGADAIKTMLSKTSRLSAECSKNGRNALKGSLKTLRGEAQRQASNWIHDALLRLVDRTDILLRWRKSAMCEQKVF